MYFLFSLDQDAIWLPILLINELQCCRGRTVTGWNTKVIAQLLLSNEAFYVADPQGKRAAESQAAPRERKNFEISNAPFIYHSFLILLDSY